MIDEEAEVVGGGRDDSEDEEDAERLRNAIEDGRLDMRGLQPQPRLFGSARDAAQSAPAQQELVEADNPDVGEVDARGRKQKNILNPNVGYTDLNAGRSAYMAGVLLPYKILVSELQCVKIPFQHQVARKLRRYYTQMQTGWIGTDAVKPVCPYIPYQDWKQRMMETGKDELLRLVEKESRAFASVMVTSLKERLRSTWNHIQSLELVDPLGPDLDLYTTPEVWDALKDLCRRRKINFGKVQEQIIAERAEAVDLDLPTKAQIRHNLIDYCGERHRGFQSVGIASPTQELDLLRAAVFSLALSSSFVESLFSKMSYTQSKTRSRLDAHTVSAIFHVHDTVMPDPAVPLDGSIKLKKRMSGSLAQQRKMEKQIDRVVCQVFDTVEGDVRYHGRVTKVKFHDVYAQWMYHVEYEDGDSADYWRHELESIFCRCDDE